MTIPNSQEAIWRAFPKHDSYLALFPIAVDLGLLPGDGIAVRVLVNDAPPSLLRPEHEEAINVKERELQMTLLSMNANGFDAELEDGRRGSFGWDLVTTYCKRHSVF
jgi:hypothetical protein